MNKPLPHGRAGGNPVAGAYRVETLRETDALLALRDDWQRLWDNDATAGLFLSWDWMMPVLRDNPGKWRVFLVRDAGTSAPCCLFPAHLDQRSDHETGEMTRVLRAAGRLAWAEYTGFLCDPEHQAAALAALANHLQGSRWSRISLNYMPDAARAELFAAAFDAARFRIRHLSNRNNSGQTDLLVVPQTRLPGSFDAYLAGLSRNKRQKMRKALREHVETGAFRLAFSTPATMPDDIDRLLALWRLRWQAEKSEGKLERTVRMQKRLFLGCHRIGVFHLPTLWHGDQAVAGLGLIEDARHGAVLVKLTGRDPATADLPVGMLLHLLVIRWAIGRGLRIYDFGHGDEPYKFSYGAEPVQLTWLSVRRRSASARR